MEYIFHNQHTMNKYLKQCIICDTEFSTKGLGTERAEKKKYCSFECYKSTLKGRKLSDHHREAIRESRIGMRHTKKTKLKISKSKKGTQAGENNPAWKEGRVIDRGYVLIHKPDHPYCDSKGYVREHRLVMEEHLERYLKPCEQVHHVNEVRNDNRIENLLLTNASDHIKKYHPEPANKGRKMSEEQKMKLSEKAKARSKEISEFMKKLWSEKDTSKRCENMSKAAKGRKKTKEHKNKISQSLKQDANQ